MISIITVSFNAESTLVDCIESVASQTELTEHILIDGASTDSTCQIIEQFRDRLALCVSEPDSGIYDAMNKGIQRASGDIIGVLNADDYYPSANILTKVKQVFTNNQIDACYGDLLYVDSQDKDKIIRNWRSGEYTSRKFYWGWMPPHPTFFVRRSAYQDYGLFNLDLGSAADYEIMLRFLLKHNLKTKYIPDVLVHMRTGGISNTSVTNRLKANQMDRKAWTVNGLKPYPWTLWFKPLRKVGQWFIK